MAHVVVNSVSPCRGYGLTNALGARQLHIEGLMQGATTGTIGGNRPAVAQQKVVQGTCRATNRAGRSQSLACDAVPDSRGSFKVCGKTPAQLAEVVAQQKNFRILHPWGKAKGRPRRKVSYDPRRLLWQLHSSSLSP